MAPSAPGQHAEEEPPPEQKTEQKAEQPRPANEKPTDTKKDKSKQPVVIIETNKGTIKAKLFTDEMPVTTKNFIELTDRGFYNGLTWHRVEPGFVIQGGDPQGNGMGGSGKTIKLEINSKHNFNKAGMLGMARSQAPDSASSQFFITLGPAPHLNSGYACFGEVTEGLDVLPKIKVGDKMTKVLMEGEKPAKETPKG
ncbi:MAG: peptidylprolyl isomerase [Armatimonadetes bacterium]|nr:peptidylprolyl isomerase [Armatimonadota bacterium]